MKKIISGKTYVLGKNIDTDQIYPGIYVQYTDPKDVAKYALAGYDPNFAKNFKSGSIIVADTNFGCGSSREHAAITLKGIGVSAIIAESFGRIFYRNAINLGLPVITCKGIHAAFHEGDQASINMETGEIKNETTGAVMHAVPFSEYIQNILDNGGIKPMIRKQQEAKRKGAAK
jgi:3-isopropylmalate/(R)-2-methylmalate dehydratase small subunit